MAVLRLLCCNLRVCPAIGLQQVDIQLPGILLIAGHYCLHVVQIYQMLKVLRKEKEGNIEYLLHRTNIIKLPCLLVLLMSFHSEVPYESYSSGALG